MEIRKDLWGEYYYLSREDTKGYKVCVRHNIEEDNYIVSSIVSDGKITDIECTYIKNPFCTTRNVIIRFKENNKHVRIHFATK